MGSNKRYLIVIILAVIAITIAAIGSVKGAVATEPVRPWYLEPPEVFQPTHIREGDRLYASYFNEQFNVIYNWAQLLNREWKNFTNGTGIASITANLITASNKLVTPVISVIKGSQPAPDGNGGLIYYDKDLDRFRAYQEGAWRDLSSNVYIASDTIGSPLTIQGYLQASNIYASNTVHAHGVNNTGTLTNTGNVTIVGNTVASGTLTVNKALTTKAGINNTGALTNTGNVTIVGNTVASGTLTVNKALTTKAGINNTGDVVTEGLNATKRLKVPTFSSTQTADSSLGKGSLYFDTTNNKLKAYNGSTWVDVASGTGEWTTSSTTGNKTINGNLNLTGVLQKGSNVVIDENGMVLANRGLQIPTAPQTFMAIPMIGQCYIRQSDNMLRYFDGSDWQNVGVSTQSVDTAMSDTSTNAVQNKVIKDYVDRKTAGISSETANINHANIIDLNGGDIDANNVTVTTKLNIPTSKTSYPTTGSICFNAASDTLNVYDNGSWISFGSGSGQGSCVLVATKTYYITGEIEYYSSDGLYDQVKENYTNYFYLNTYSDGHLVLNIKEPLAERKASIHSTYSAHSSKFYILPGTELFNLLHDKNAVLVNVPDDGHYVGLPSAETDGENIIGNIYFRYIDAGDAGIIIDSIISWTSISITGHRVRMYGYKEPTIFFYPNN